MGDPREKMKLKKKASGKRTLKKGALAAKRKAIARKKKALTPDRDEAGKFIKK